MSSITKTESAVTYGELTPSFKTYSDEAAYYGEFVFSDGRTLQVKKTEESESALKVLTEIEEPDLILGSALSMMRFAEVVASECALSDFDEHAHIGGNVMGKAIEVHTPAELRDWYVAIVDDSCVQQREANCHFLRESAGKQGVRAFTVGRVTAS